MRIKDVATQLNVDEKELHDWLHYTKAYSEFVKENSIKGMTISNNVDLHRLLSDFKKAKADRDARLQIEEQDRKIKEETIASILLSNCSTLDGYRISYGSYISETKTIEVKRKETINLSESTGVNIHNALVELRKQALYSLKEIAFDHGCNAIIGLNYQFITMDPHTVNLSRGITYEPYVLSLTVTGNAVKIEKI